MEYYNKVRIYRMEKWHSARGFGGKRVKTVKGRAQCKSGSALISQNKICPHLHFVTAEKQKDNYSKLKKFKQVIRTVKTALTLSKKT